MMFLLAQDTTGTEACPNDLDKPTCFIGLQGIDKSSKISIFHAWAN